MRELRVSRCACLIGALADKRHGIDPLTVAQHFEVQIRARRAARVTHQRNGLTFPDFLANINEVFRIVRVTGCISIAVIDFDQFAETVTR